MTQDALTEDGALPSADVARRRAALGDGTARRQIEAGG